jgi:hypothetical protein
MPGKLPIIHAAAVATLLRCNERFPQEESNMKIIRNILKRIHLTHTF